MGVQRAGKPAGREVVGTAEWKQNRKFPSLHTFWTRKKKTLDTGTDIEVCCATPLPNEPASQPGTTRVRKLLTKDR